MVQEETSSKELDNSMIKIITISLLLNINDAYIMPPREARIEAGRKRGKGNKGRRRGGSGLRQDGKKRERYNGTDVSRMVV